MKGLTMRRPTTARALADARAPLLTGVLIGSIAALVVAMLGWAAWAEVDEVVVAQGRVVPAGRVKLINHPHGGRVASVQVVEGQKVEPGTVLLGLDGSVAGSELAELLGRRQVEAAAVARLAAEANATAMAPDAALAAERPDLIEAEQRLLTARATALVGRRQTAARSVEARRSELRTAAAESGRVRNSLVLLKQNTSLDLAVPDPV